MFLLGLGASYILYVVKTDLPGKLAESFQGLYQFLLNAWYFDKLYDRLFVQPAKFIGQGFWKTGDETIIDGYGVNGLAATIGRMAQAMRRLQSGYMYHYAFAMLLGVLVLVTFYAA